MGTNDNITRLLEMLDNPEAYSEQAIHDIIHRDEDTRQAYQLMVAAKQGYRHRQAAHSATDTQAAWERVLGELENEKIKKLKNERTENKRKTSGKSFNSSILPSFNPYKKIAASFVGVLLVSGIAFATIRIVHHGAWGNTESPAQEAQVENASQQSVHAPTTPTDTTTTVHPVVFDNVPLEKMLSEIASHYGDGEANISVVFRNDGARRLRFYFVWNDAQSIEKVVDDLNRFERLHVTLKDNQIIVE